MLEVNLDHSIRADLAESHGMDCVEHTRVVGGWLNRKWRVSTGAGDVLVKQFSTKRYDREKLILLEHALQRQVALEKDGVPCPHVWTFKDKVIRSLDEDTAYMVMDFHSGKTENASTITRAQLCSLGDACGQMHAAFSRLPSASVVGISLTADRLLEICREHLRCQTLVSSTGSSKEFSSTSSTEEISPIASNKDFSQHESPEGFPPIGSLEAFHLAVHSSTHILQSLSPDFLRTLPMGISHEDFAEDNLLFHSDRVSAILDFDRNHYSFRWHDIGRALLSFAFEEHPTKLENGSLNLNKIQAFLEGYTRHFNLTQSNIADALRLTWCMEVPWWLHPGTFEESAHSKIVRFRNEILWLTAHWSELDDMLAP